MKDDERINLRLKHNAKVLLERAASIEAQSVSKFVLNCALSEAEKTLQAYETLQLNRQEANDFFDALSQPITFNDKLTAALNAHILFIWMSCQML